MSPYPTTVTVCWHWTCHPPLWNNLVWHNSGRNINPSPYPTMVTTHWHWPHHSPPWGCTVCRWWWCSVGSDPLAPPSGRWSGESVTQHNHHGPSAIWPSCSHSCKVINCVENTPPPPPPKNTHKNTHQQQKQTHWQRVANPHTLSHRPKVSALPPGVPLNFPCHMHPHYPSCHTTPLATHTHTYYPSCHTDPH